MPGLHLAMRSGQAESAAGQSVLPGGTSDIGGDNVGGVPVQTAAGTVISHGGPGIGVRGGFLHIPQRHPGVQRRGDERMPQKLLLSSAVAKVAA